MLGRNSCLIYFAVSRNQDIKGEPPVKPKRKKPGTAMKRKVQPIPVDAKGIKKKLSCDVFFSKGRSI